MVNNAHFCCHFCTKKVACAPYGCQIGFLKWQYLVSNLSQATPSFIKASSKDKMCHLHKLMYGSCMEWTNQHISPIHWTHPLFPNPLACMWWLLVISCSYWLSMLKIWWSQEISFKRLNGSNNNFVNNSPWPFFFVPWYGFLSHYSWCDVPPLICSKMSHWHELEWLLSESNPHGSQ
jgi:hypothetical protein